MGVCPQSVPQTEPLSETCNVLTPTRTPTNTPTLTPNCGAIRVGEAFGAVFVRREPNDASTENIIGAFYNQTRTRQDGSTYLYVNPAQRNYTPLGKTLDANNYYWVRVHHNPQINNGTQGWMRSDSLDLLACGGINAIPEIPAASVGYGPNGLTPISDINTALPSLNELWLPFGDCQGYADDQDRRHCSFDVLATLQADGGVSIRDILTIALMYEMGSVLTDYRGIPANQLEANLSIEVKYHLEAVTRNFTAFCLHSNSTATCSLQSVLNWLLGIQGWYDQYGKTANQIKVNGDNNVTNFGNFPVYMFSKSDWLTGLQANKPFTWGNWVHGQTSYNTISTIIDNNGNPFTCTTCPTSDLFYARRFSSPGSCNYIFAITVSNHPYGQTSACSAGRFTSFNTPILPFPNHRN